MKFYLDFEATQFSRRIISIGCVTETGERFNTLVKPVNGDKVGKYVTDLTNITDEMVAVAPTADEAFKNFFAWFLMYETGLPQFFTYGNDGQYIDATIKYMNDPVAIVFANSIKACLVDYSKVVAEHIQTRGISLRTLVAMIEKDNEIVQRHDALEDAEWLKLVATNLNTIPTQPKAPTVQKQLRTVKTTDIISVGLFPVPHFRNLKKEPDHINKMNNGQKSMWKNVEDGSLGSKDDWAIRCWNDDHEVFFRNIEDAVYWTCKASTTSLKKMANCQTRWVNICKCAKNGTKFCHVFWEIKSIEQEVKEND